jgi:hypothetical protein
MDKIPFSELTIREKWLITIIVFFVTGMSFVAGVYSSSNSYEYRYPNEYNWWVDHQQSHFPGVIISPAVKNSSCHQSGNIHPPVGKNITQIQWVGGWDAGFVGNFKVLYDDTEMIVPVPEVGKCVYIYNVTGKIVVYGQDSTSGGWTKLGSSNSSHQ